MKNRKPSDSTFTWIVVILLLAMFMYFSSCTWPGIIVPPDPEPVQLDTVCTTYDPVLQPAFITGYMIMDGFVGDRILKVGNHVDTIAETEDIQIALDSLLGLLFGSLERRVYVNDTNQNLMTAFIIGTNDLTKLTGKIRIVTDHAIYHFGTIMRGMVSMGSQTPEEFLANIIGLPSFYLISWYGMHLDSIEYITHGWAALDTTHCKGGQYWFQTQFNDFPIIPEIPAHAVHVDWQNVQTIAGEDVLAFGIVDLTDRRATDYEISYWLEKGFAVKTCQ